MRTYIHTLPLSPNEHLARTYVDSLENPHTDSLDRQWNADGSHNITYMTITDLTPISSLLLLFKGRDRSYLTCPVDVPRHSPNDAETDSKLTRSDWQVIPSN